MKPTSHLVGLRSTSVRQRLAFLKAALVVLRDPSQLTKDPIGYGQALQRIHHAFELWGRERTIDDPNIAHNMGRVQLETLEALYEKWEAEA